MRVLQIKLLASFHQNFKDLVKLAPSTPGTVRALGPLSYNETNTLSQPIAPMPETPATTEPPDPGSTSRKLTYLATQIIIPPTVRSVAGAQMQRDCTIWMARSSNIPAQLPTRSSARRSIGARAKNSSLGKQCVKFFMEGSLSNKTAILI